jgi:hypothetical protein
MASAVDVSITTTLAGARMAPNWLSKEAINSPGLILKLADSARLEAEEMVKQTSLSGFDFEVEINSSTD